MCILRLLSMLHCRFTLGDANRNVWVLNASAHWAPAVQVLYFAGLMCTPGNGQKKVCKTVCLPSCVSLFSLILRAFEFVLFCHGFQEHAFVNIHTVLDIQQANAAPLA